MTGPFVISPKRVEELGDAVPALRQFWPVPPPIIFESAVLCPDPYGVDSARFAAALDTVASSRAAGVPHIIMLDDASHTDVAPALQQKGAIVVPIRHATEGGLARPHIIAATLIDTYAGINPTMVKVEGEKNLLHHHELLTDFMWARERFDVATGVRRRATWESMPGYQCVTESVISTAIACIAGVPYDTPSGVIALSGRGRTLLQGIETNDHSYLIRLPSNAKKAGLRVGAFLVDFRYHPQVIHEENSTKQRAFDEKRRVQIQLMIDSAVETAGGLSALRPDQRMAYDNAMYTLMGLQAVAAR